jgi:hypothetical protein
LGGLLDIEAVKNRLKLELADLFDVELMVDFTFAQHLRPHAHSSASSSSGIIGYCR